MSDYEISIHPAKCNENLILGGSTPLYDVLEKLYFQPKVLKSLKSWGILFLSQITSSNGSHLLNVKDLSYRPLLSTSSKLPYWFYLVESLVLLSPTTSRRLLSQWCTMSNIYYKDFIVSPSDNNRTQDWIAIYDDIQVNAILGYIIKKFPTQNEIIVEHWYHYLDESPTSPSFQKSVVKRCTRCHLDDPRYNITNV